MLARIAALVTLLLISISASAQPLSLPGCVVTDYGRGVYYLKCYEVGPAMAKLREMYPQANFAITSSSFAAGLFSLGTTGYYVVFNPPLPSK